MDRVAIALVPTIMRAYSITWNIWAMPAWTSPSSQPTAGTSPSPNVSSLVVEALDPHLLLEVGRVDPVALAGELAGLGVEVQLGHDEEGEALVPGPPWPRRRTGGRGRGGRCSGQVVLGGGDKALDALDVPGAVRLRDGARAPEPTSEPASGSVSTMVAPQWCSTMILAIRRSRSVPFIQIMYANLVPAP